MKEISARIRAPRRSAMQSGRRSTMWIVEYRVSPGTLVDPLTGWPGSAEARTQIRVSFESLSAAIAFVRSKQLSFEIWEAQTENATPAKVYADNFRPSRRENWTH